MSLTTSCEENYVSNIFTLLFDKNNLGNVVIFFFLIICINYLTQVYVTRAESNARKINQWRCSNDRGRYFYTNARDKIGECLEDGKNFHTYTTFSSSRLHYEIGVNGEVESCKPEFSEAKQQWIESKGELVETKRELAKTMEQVVLIHEAKIQQQNQLKLILARLHSSLR